MWATHTPSFWRGDVEWDMKFDQGGKSLEPFRGSGLQRRPSSEQEKKP
jgi:hypothetical protein